MFVLMALMVVIRVDMVHSPVYGDVMCGRKKNMPLETGSSK